MNENNPKTAAALIIGNELLSGKIEDRNLFVLAKTLRQIGVALTRSVTILDDLETIAREVRHLSATHDWVFTSGGVGPTHDDLTMDAIAAAFSVNVVMSPKMEEMLRGYYGASITEGHLRMARIPEGSCLLFSDKIPWPSVVMRNVWMLPGIPEIFRSKMTLVQKELSGAIPFYSQMLLTTLDEGVLKPFLDQVVNSFPDVDIGSYPTMSETHYRTKITFDSRDVARIEQAKKTLGDLLPAKSVVS